MPSIGVRRGEQAKCFASGRCTDDNRCGRMKEVMVVKGE